LEDGRTVTGTTDQEGKTSLIKSANKELEVTRIELLVTDKSQPLCPRKGINPGEPCYLIGFEDAIGDGSRYKVKPIVIELEETIKTNDREGSLVRISLPGKTRLLTKGEIAMLRKIFKDSLNYSIVKIHNRKWKFFQNSNYAMAPYGELYDPRERFIADYSTEEEANQILFIHEMMHVWQYQQGYNVFWAGLYRWPLYLGGRIYKYRFEGEGKDFFEYGFEQQAEIVSHYYGEKFLNVMVGDEPRLPFLERVLKEFLDNPYMK
jgi:type VI secretion system secreted protein VgrG